MPRKFEFKNDNGETLSGALEEPTAELRRGVALFAHCFSCGKNVLAASRVSRGLRERGFTVLRFDFTGLGESEGEFADTNFSTNVDDLRAAINAMRQEGMAPDILIGHSLGGAAVLDLAEEIEEVKLVATIGAPSEPRHVVHLFDETAMQQIEQTGQAEVSLGGRPFTIKKQFLDDVTETSVLKKLGSSRKPLLICHSPTDNVVGVDNAQKIYKAAKHPRASCRSMELTIYSAANKTLILWHPSLPVGRLATLIHRTAKRQTHQCQPLPTTLSPGKITAELR